MKKPYKNIFDRLSDQQKARLIPVDQVDRKIRSHFTLNTAMSLIEPLTHKPYFIEEGASYYQKQLLKEFAEELSLPIELLIDQFARSGVPNLTAEHLIEQRHKTLLLDYLRAEHGAKRKLEILQEYSHNEVTSQQTTLLEEVNDELLFLLAKQPELIYQLGHRKFEELIAKLFSDRGYEVSLTKKTRDGGYDLLAKINDPIASFVILAECKKYNPNKKVGVEFVRSLYGVTEEKKANKGLTITSSFFTKDAHTEQVRIGDRIGLKDYNDLVNWLKPLN